MENVTKIYAPWVALLSLLSTLCVSYCSYSKSVDRDAVSRVLEFAKDYRSALLINQVSLNEKWRAVLEGEIIPLLKDGTVSDQDKIRSKSAITVSFLSRDSDAAAAFVSLEIFYSNLSSCVMAGVCDCNAAQRFFKGDVVAFRDAMYPELSRRKQIGDDSLTLLDDLLNRTCG